mgnify:FL=1
MLGKKIDLIVANPPYVRESEKEKMAANVLNYEPHLALFVSENDPLIFYRKILEFAVDNLSDEGFLFFEINEYLGAEMTKLFYDNDFDIEIKKDVFGKDRMVKGKRK